MSIKKKDGSYQCFFCDFTSKNAVKVQAHQDSSHEYVVFPIQIEDLNRLIQFIYFKDDKLIRPELLKLMKYYVKRAVRRGTHTMESLNDDE